jgi:hypothetical protein
MFCTESIDETSMSSLSSSGLELRQAFDETRDDPTSRSPLTRAGQTVDEQDGLKR